MNKEKWVAVVVSIFIVGFFFVFGSNVLSIFKMNNNANNPSKLVVQDATLGQGEEAQSGDRVIVHYVGRFVDGKIFDSSLSRKEPFQFVLGLGQVIPGWDQGIVGMKVGGVRILTIPPELAYGTNGYGPIPPNSTLIFEVQLLKVEK
jgi:FKBP-type peptidyl-prolyl cis-trans isomerase